MDKTSSPANSPVETARNVHRVTIAHLFSRAAGRCQFHGCNEFLMEHPLTLDAGNFAEQAHIVAFKEAGPRGKEGERPKDINAATNLMLLCQRDHKFIDDNPDRFPRPLLEDWKREHEERIRRVTESGSDQRTALFVLRAPIAGKTVVIPPDHVAAAAFPRYPLSRDGVVVDLGVLGGSMESSAYWQAGKQAIDRGIERLDALGEIAAASHLSVFALAPMPLLIYAGSRLPSAVPTELYQRHRDTEDWVWKSNANRPAAYRHQLIKEGVKGGQVTVIFALSGTIPPDQIPEETKKDAWLYQFTLENLTPDPTFLATKADLERFRIEYQALLGNIAAQHGIISEINIIPAVPAPIAVLLGRERLPKVHPALRVFDRDPKAGGYGFILRVD